MLKFTCKDTSGSNTYGKVVFHSSRFIQLFGVVLKCLATKNYLKINEMVILLIDVASFLAELNNKPFGELDCWPWQIETDMTHPTVKKRPIVAQSERGILNRERHELQHVPFLLFNQYNNVHS